jgi:hypothetical protein
MTWLPVWWPPHGRRFGDRTRELPAFQRQLNRAILAQTGGETVYRQLIVDAFLDLQEIDLPLVEALDSSPRLVRGIRRSLLQPVICI